MTVSANKIAIAYKSIGKHESGMSSFHGEEVSAVFIDVAVSLPVLLLFTL